MKARMKKRGMTVTVHSLESRAIISQALAHSALNQMDSDFRWHVVPQQHAPHPTLGNYSDWCMEEMRYLWQWEYIGVIECNGREVARTRPYLNFARMLQETAALLEQQRCQPRAWMNGRPVTAVLERV